MIAFCYYVDEPLFNSGRNIPAKTYGFGHYQNRSSANALTRTGELCSGLTATDRELHNWLLASERLVHGPLPLPWQELRQSAHGRF